MRLLVVLFLATGSLWAVACARAQTDADRLFFACLAGDLGQCRQLLMGGADPNQPDRTGMLPIDAAAMVPNGDRVMSILVAHGACVSEPDRIPSNRWLPLHYAASKGSLAATRFLIQNGARVNAVDHRHRTALFYAAIRGQVKEVALLLSLGADRSIPDDAGLTPIKGLRKFEATYASKAGGLRQKLEACAVELQERPEPRK